MDPTAPPTRLYPRGAYLCVTSQTSPVTFLMCKTCTVVTTNSILVPVLWLRQMDQAGIYRISIKSDVLVSSIIGEVMVTEMGKTVEVDMLEVVTGENLLTEEQVNTAGMVVVRGNIRSTILNPGR